MTQTAFSIANVTFSGSLGGFAGNEPHLSVDFQIFNRGPFHVAGLIVTTDFWVTSQVAPATFQSFGAISGLPFGFEFWRATFDGPRLNPGQSATFDFVIFCDDFGGADSVPRIWNTNGGNPFQLTVGFP